MILWLIAYAVDSESWKDLGEPAQRQLICPHFAAPRHFVVVNIYRRRIHKGLTASSWVAPIIRIHNQAIIHTHLMWELLCCQGKLFSGGTR